MRGKWVSLCMIAFVVFLLMAKPVSAATTTTATVTNSLGVIVTPAPATMGDTVSVIVISTVFTETVTRTTVNNTTTAQFSNSSAPSPGPISLSIHSSSGLTLPESCEVCVLKNGTYLTVIPVNSMLGYRTVYVDAFDEYTKVHASSSFAVIITPADIITSNNDANRRLAENITAQNVAVQIARDNQQYAFFGVVIFFAIALELRRSYRSAKDFNLETWVDKIRRPFGSRKTPFTKVMDSSEPLYAGANQQIQRQMIRYNKRVLGSALKDAIELLEMYKSMEIHEAEVTRTIQASRTALGLPAEPGLPGYKLQQFGSSIERHDVPRKGVPKATDGGGSVN